MARPVARRRVESLTQFLEDVNAQVARLPASTMRALRPLLAEAEAELTRDLRVVLGRADGEQRYDAQMHRRALLQIRGALSTIDRARPEIAGALIDGVDRGGRLATDILRQEFARFARRYDGSIAPIPLNEAALLAEGRQMLVLRMQTSAARYTGQVREDIQRQLALGLVRSETVGQLTQRLVRMGGPRGAVALRGIAGQLGAHVEQISEGLFTRYRWWAERLARTEVNHAYNVQANLGIEQAAQEVPGLVRRWDAALDARVCPECRALDHQTAPIGKPFSGGILQPPKHPNCRCALVAWHPAWETGASTPTVAEEEARRRQEINRAAVGTQALANIGAAVAAAQRAEGTAVAMQNLGKAVMAAEKGKGTVLAMQNLGAAIASAEKAAGGVLAMKNVAQATSSVTDAQELKALAHEKGKAIAIYRASSAEAIAANDAFLQKAFAHYPLGPVVVTALKKAEGEGFEAGLKWKKKSDAAKKAAQTRAITRAAKQRLAAAQMPTPTPTHFATTSTTRRLSAADLPKHRLIGHHGHAVRADADVIENHDVQVRRIIATDGKPYQEVEFRVNDNHASRFRSALPWSDDTWRYERRRLVGGVLTDEGGDVATGLASRRASSSGYDVEMGQKGALKNCVRLRVPGDDPDDVVSALSHFGGLASSGGVDMLQLPNTAARDLRAKASIAAHFDPAGYARNAAQLSPAEIERKFQAVLAQHPEAAAILADVEEREVFPGHHALYSKRLAKIMSDGDVKFLYHDTGKDADIIAAMMDSGLLSSRTRFSSGIFVKGMSTGTDFETGGADGFFVRVSKWDREAERARSKYRLIVHADELGRLDHWAFDFDNYGRSGFDTYSQRWTVPEMAAMRVPSSSNEVMLQHGVKPENVRGIVARDAAAQRELIDEFTRQGKTKINGIPLNQFITVGR